LHFLAECVSWALMSGLLIHGTSLSLYYQGRWRGVLIGGESGIGKSDLALRALACGYVLISDDYSQVFASGTQLYITAPKTILGRMEIRGLGIVPQPSRLLTRLDVVVHCQSQAPERLPEPEVTPLLDIMVPTLRLDPKQASSLMKMDFCIKNWV